METPSDRVLASWREHAREGWYFESYGRYPQRWITGLTMTDEEAADFRKKWNAKPLQVIYAGSFQDSELYRVGG
jgi:hypothetical protein